jgi:EmrB/QacA subfamily drug resistance transporter
MDAPKGPEPQPALLDHAEIRAIIIGILLAMLLAALDQTIVATALPTIGRELGKVELLPWVVTAYLIASMAVTPLYGKISDIHGRRGTLLVSIGIFVFGSIVCALARTMLTLVIARAVQGLGGGGLISLAQTIIADIVSPKERSRYQGYIASVFMAASLAGPVLGGFIAEHLDWSLIFWINLPLGLVAFLMTNSLLRKLPRHERPHRLDIAGAVIMVAATVTLMLALNWGGVRYEWVSWPIIGLVAVSLALWASFVVWIMHTSEPLIPLAVLANQVVRSGTLAACFGMGTYIGLTIYMPIYFQAIVGLSASDAGLATIPLMLGTVTGATLSGRIMSRVKRYKLLPMAGLAGAIACLSFLVFEPRGLPLVAVEIILGVTSLGLGMLLPVTTVAIQNAVELHQLGTTTASMNFFRSLGGAITVAVYGAIVLGSGAVGRGQALTAESVATHIGQNVALARPFRWVFLAAAAGLAVALAWLAVMEERPFAQLPREGRGRPFRSE